MTADGANGPALPGDDFPRRLATEVGYWERDGLISPEQSEAILRRYASSDAGALPAEPAIGDGEPAASRGEVDERTTLVSRAVSAIGVMGALLVGLGIIIYVAANWDVIPVWSRVSMLVGLTAATNVAGWLLLTRFDYPRVGVAMLVVGALAYGAAIHLIAQIYHVPVNHPNLTTAWFLGVLPLAYIARSRVMVALALTLLVLSMGFRTQWWLEYYGAETLLLLTPLTLAIAAAVVALGLLQLRFTWTRPLAVYCYLPGLVIGLAAFCVMTFASPWTEGENLSLAVLSPEYWITAGLALATTVVATAGLWWRVGGQRDGCLLARTAIVATMAVTGAGMWIWFAYPEPGVWWLFNVIAFGGIGAAAAAKRSPLLLGGATSLFVILFAVRFVSLVDIDSASAAILLSAAALTVGAWILAGSFAISIVPLVARYARYVAGAGLALAASSLHVMGYGTFWRWDDPPGWSWMPAEYWIVLVVGWLISAAAVGFAVWRSGRAGQTSAIWTVGAIGAMAALTIAMWLGLGYQVSSAWAMFNIALLAGIAALIWYGYRLRQLSIAYFACSIFAFSVIVRCFAALGILAEGDLLLWLGPVVLGIGALVFLTGRLRVRWTGVSTVELRTNSRVWDLAGLSVAIVSVYAMSYSDPWAIGEDTTGSSALAFLGEYWFLAGTVWGAASTGLILIWVVDRTQSSPVHASADQLRWETSAAVAMGALAMLTWLGLLLSWTWTWLPINAALLATVLALVAAGYRWNRSDLINLAVITFGVTLFTRYFEFGFGLLGQSLAFIVAGAIMLGMGFGLEFLRRRMLRSVRVVEEPA